jgi:ABC-2 type transport system permease protein
LARSNCSGLRRLQPARQDLAFTLPNAIPQSLQAIGVSIPSTIHMVLGLGVPMRGTWLDLGVTLLLLDAASLAFGFVISALSNTETQAVQLTMLVLLMSVFFSGFFLNLGNFLVPIRYVAYLLPVSYAIQQLQAIMLRGLPVDLKDLAVLGGGSVLLFLLAYWLFKRQLVSGE